MTNQTPCLFGFKSYPVVKLRSVTEIYQQLARPQCFTISMHQASCLPFITSALGCVYWGSDLYITPQACERRDRLAEFKNIVNPPGQYTDYTFIQELVDANQEKWTRFSFEKVVGAIGFSKYMRAFLSANITYHNFREHNEFYIRRKDQAPKDRLTPDSLAMAIDLVGGGLLDNYMETVVEAQIAESP